MPPLGYRFRRAFRKLRWEIVRGGPGRAQRILTVPTENGLLSMSNMDVVVAKGLFIQRAWELELMAQTIGFLRTQGFADKPGIDLMVDVGANIGMICIAMLRHGFFREAVALEPGPDNFALLARNITQNGMRDRIRALQVAISDATGEVEMECSGVNFGDHRVRTSLSLAPALMSEGSRLTLRVRARTLDDVLATDGTVDPRRIGLIWVDIQGHDGHLFRGARKTLAHGMPVLTEFWPYGILRSGLDRDTYCEIITSTFSRLAIMDAGSSQFEERDVTVLPALFDAFAQPDQNLELILFPQ